MTTARHLLVAMGALAALAAVRPANALTVDQYLALRRSANCDRRLAYAAIETNPSAFLNKVIEMRGTVNGAIRRETGVAFLLTIDEKHSILLNAPAADATLVSEVRNQLVRVLARVTDGVVGNVVPLDVLGVAYDGEVATREKSAELQEARESQRQVRSASPAAARPLSSRGGGTGGYYARQMTGGGGDGPAIAQGLSAEAKTVFGIYRGYILKCNPRLSMKELDEITTSLLYYSQKHLVDPRLVVSMIIAESDFNPRSTSNKGAMGLGQIMPDEARSHGVVNPYDVIENMRTAINLLRMKLDIYSDGAPPGQTSFRQRQLALAAYNAGGGAVKKYGGVPPYKETQRYVAKIEILYRQLCGVD